MPNEIGTKGQLHACGTHNISSEELEKLNSGFLISIIHGRYFSYFTILLCGVKWAFSVIPYLALKINEFLFYPINIIILLDKI